MSQGVLGKILAAKAEEVAPLVRNNQELASLALDTPAPPNFLAALRECPHTPIIAEIKRKSPSRGDIRAGADPGHLALAYRGGGAAALSVLTDQQFFGGQLRDLRQAALASGLPCLRKDFIIHEVQIHQARANGAAAVLLIAEALPGGQLAELYQVALADGLTPLVELHGPEQLQRVLDLDPKLVGINNRDLVTLKVDLAQSLRLRPQIPAEVLVVAESGISERRQVEELTAAGLNAFLVGSSLMASGEPGQALAALCGRKAA